MLATVGFCPAFATGKYLMMTMTSSALQKTSRSPSYRLGDARVARTPTVQLAATFAARPGRDGRQWSSAIATARDGSNSAPFWTLVCNRVADW